MPACLMCACMHACMYICMSVLTRPNKLTRFTGLTGPKQKVEKHRKTHIIYTYGIFQKQAKTKRGHMKNMEEQHDNAEDEQHKENTQNGTLGGTMKRKQKQAKKKKKKKKKKKTKKKKAKK